jgi:hypothetical protein
VAVFSFLWHVECRSKFTCAPTLDAMAASERGLVIEVSTQSRMIKLWLFLGQGFIWWQNP